MVRSFFIELWSVLMLAEEGWQVSVYGSVYGVSKEVGTPELPTG